jgi:hypothetical protein
MSVVRFFGAAFRHYVLATFCESSWRVFEERKVNSKSYPTTAKS